MSSDRPPTSKPRGPCRFHHETRRCFAGDKCKFLHDDGLTPFDRAKLCRYYTNGFCHRGDRCWFRHVTPVSSKGQEYPKDDNESICCICLETPTTYGLLAGCSHVYCIQCIRQWRDPTGKSSDVVGSGVTKKCPLCRSASRFITPSSRFYPQDTQEKEVAIERYKKSMARVPCRYFQNSRTSQRFCPFGRDCFYQHVNSDGSPHFFDDDADHNMKIYCSRRNRSHSPHVLEELTRLGAAIAAIRATWSEIASEDVDGDGGISDFNAFERPGLGGEGGPDDLGEGQPESERRMDELEAALLESLVSFREEDDHDDDDDDDDGLPRVSQLSENTTLNVEAGMDEMVESNDEDEEGYEGGHEYSIAPPSPNTVSAPETLLPVTLAVADSSSSSRWEEEVKNSSDGWPDPGWSSMNTDLGRAREDLDNRATTSHSSDCHNSSWEDTEVVESQSGTLSVQPFRMNGPPINQRTPRSLTAQEIAFQAVQGEGYFDHEPSFSASTPSIITPECATFEISSVSSSERDSAVNYPGTKEGLSVPQNHVNQSFLWDDTGVVEGQSDSLSVQMIGKNKPAFDRRREDAEDVKGEPKPIRAFDLSSVGWAPTDASRPDRDGPHGSGMSEENKDGREEETAEAEAEGMCWRVPEGDEEEREAVEVSSDIGGEQAEPPFVTDGRGRVVWSSVRPMPCRGTRGRLIGGVKGKMVEKAVGNGAPVSDAGGGGGFMTDGRGRVIGTSEESPLANGEGCEAEVAVEKGVKENC